MKSFQFNTPGKPSEVLKLAHIPIPLPLSNEVRVKVVSASLNPVDLMVMSGSLVGAGWSLELPFHPGYDFSGVVDAVGEAVKSFKAGEAVFAVNWKAEGEADPAHIGNHGNGPRVGGALSEYIVVPASKLSHKPEGVTHAQAAAVALVGTTAYQGLDTLGVTKGTRVLILGGASSVGQIAIQLAKGRGAWVATTASARTKDFVAGLGAADLIVDYGSEKWWTLDSLKGVDAVFDTVGEGEVFAHAKLIVKEGGKFLSIANHDAAYNPSAHGPQFSWASWMCLRNSPKIQDELASLIASKKLKIAIDQSFPFTEDGVQSAFAKVSSGKSIGKNVIELP